MPKKKKEKVFTLEFFKKHGARGGAVGGKIGSANMTPEQRSERAKKAVAARKWHPLVSQAEKAKRAKAKAKLPKRPVGRPRKVIDPSETT